MVLHGKKGRVRKFFSHIGSSWMMKTLMMHLRHAKELSLDSSALLSYYGFLVLFFALTFLLHTASQRLLGVHRLFVLFFALVIIFDLFLFSWCLRRGIRKLIADKHKRQVSPSWRSAMVLVIYLFIFYVLMLLLDQILHWITKPAFLPFLRGVAGTLFFATMLLLFVSVSSAGQFSKRNPLFVFWQGVLLLFRSWKESLVLLLLVVLSVALLGLLHLLVYDGLSVLFSSFSLAWGGSVLYYQPRIFSLLLVALLLFFVALLYMQMLRRA